MQFESRTVKETKEVGEWTSKITCERGPETETYEVSAFVTLGLIKKKDESKLMIWANGKAEDQIHILRKAPEMLITFIDQLSAAMDSSMNKE